MDLFENIYNVLAKNTEKEITNNGFKKVKLDNKLVFFEKEKTKNSNLIYVNTSVLVKKELTTYYVIVDKRFKFAEVLKKVTGNITIDPFHSNVSYYHARFKVDSKIRKSLNEEYLELIKSLFN